MTQQIVIIRQRSKPMPPPAAAAIISIGRSLDESLDSSAAP